MKNSFVAKIAAWIYNGLEKFSQAKYWVLMATIIISIFSFAYVLPKVTRGKKLEGPGMDTISAERRVMKMQIAHPLTVLPDYGGNQLTSHPGKMQFRLAMPVIGHFLHLNYAQLLYLQGVLGVFFFALLILLILRATNDKVAALLGTLGFAFVYFSSGFFADNIPYYDGLAYFCLACAMYFRNPLLVFAFVFLCSWTDERGLLTSSLVLVWWQVVNRGEKLSLGGLLRLSKQSIAVLLAWALYIGGRYFLTTHYGLKTQSDGMFSSEVLRAHKFHVILGLFAGLRWFWVVIVLGFAWLMKDKNYFLALVLLAIAAVLTFSSAIVYDHLRSVAYMFPLVIILLYARGRNPENIMSLRNLLLIVLILNFLMTPIKMILGGTS